MIFDLSLSEEDKLEGKDDELERHPIALKQGSNQLRRLPRLGFALHSARGTPHTNFYSYPTTRLTTLIGAGAHDLGRVVAASLLCVQRGSTTHRRPGMRHP